MPAHLRVSLSDRPGALAGLTRALAAAGANVLAVTVLERDQGRAVDDLLLDWPYERPFDAVVRAVAGSDGARLHGLRHVAETAVSRDCDLVLQLADQPGRALETLVDALPHVLLADWAAVLDRRWPREAVHHTAGSPLPLPLTAAALDRGRAFVVDGEATLLMPVPDTTLRILVGRYDVPAFTRAELERATALVAAAAAVVRLAFRPETTELPQGATRQMLDPEPAEPLGAGSAG
jgi:hypothetical protein